MASFLDKHFDLHTNQAESSTLPEIIPQYSHSGLILLRALHDSYLGDQNSKERAKALATNYQLRGTSQHILIEFSTLSLGEYQQLSANFKENPLVGANTALANLHSIARDPQQDESHNRARLERYLSSYYSVITALDKRKYSLEKANQLKALQQNIADAIWRGKNDPLENLSPLASLMI